MKFASLQVKQKKNSSILQKKKKKIETNYKQQKRK